MNRFSVACPRVLLAILLLACQPGEKQREASAELLAGIPAMPRSAPVSSSAGTEAVEFRYSTPVAPDSVAAWYRLWFLKNGWHIGGDLPSPGGGVTLSVEKEHRSVWLLVRPAAGRQGSVFSVLAAGADSSVGSASR
jgi:hypothetical protein